MPFVATHNAADFAAADTPRARAFFVVGKRGLLARARSDAGAATLPGWELPTESELMGLGLRVDDALGFGRWSREGAAERDTFALPVPDELALPQGFSLLGIRTLVEAFDAETFGIAGHASHVLDWWTTSRFCGRCGAQTERVAHEWCMRCPACALSVYPRIAPAVIVLVRKGDKALLARNARFPVPFYSTLAGFADIGETLEETLAREVFEEVGVRVKSIRYFGSQPWPFPHSLMIAFTAEWESGDIKVDNVEIADAAWFSHDELPLVPPHASVARKLIDAWVRELSPA